MRLLPLAAASALALSATACAPHVNPALRTKLDCPSREGALVRTSISADGKSCAYRADDAEVNLQLTPVSGDPTTTLSAVETSLVGSKVAPASSGPAETSASASGDAAKAASEAQSDAGQTGGSGKDWETSDSHTVIIDKNGRHMGVRTDGDHAHVDFPGIHIDAEGDNAKVDVAGVHIDAANDEATVRVMRDVRLAGQGFSAARNGLRATFIAKRNDLPGGYRYVGYEAAGPKAGPLTIATIRAQGDMDDHGRIYRDIRRLVRRNGGA